MRETILHDFFSDVRTLKSELNKNMIWYRGHSNSNYQLTPTVLRKYKASANESNLFYEFKTLSATLSKRTRTNWDILFDMQHYGVPTRLLDWTTNLGTALYFAIKDNPSSPCIWLLSPFDLNLKSTGFDIIIDPAVISDNPAPHQTYLNVDNILGSKNTYELPFAIQVPHGNKRLSAQRGMFTVHGMDRAPLDSLCKQFVRKIEIPIEIISELKEHLWELGVDDFSLFPDYEGLSKYLKNKFDL